MRPTTPSDSSFPVARFYEMLRDASLEKLRSFTAVAGLMSAGVWLNLKGILFLHYLFHRFFFFNLRSAHFALAPSVSSGSIVCYFNL